MNFFDILDLLGARCVCETVERLSPRELIAGVCMYLETKDNIRTANILYRQTGGNALFIDHVLRHFIDEGIIIKNNDNDTHMYRIDHFILFEQRITSLPTNISLFLSSRLNNVCEKDTELSATLAAYLTLTAARIQASSLRDIGIVPDKRIISVLQCKGSKADRLHQRLLSAGIIIELAHGRIDFVHDLILAAASTFAEKQIAVQDATLDYLKQLSKDDFVDTLLGGRLNRVPL